jgi:hypothetical protein
MVFIKKWKVKDLKDKHIWLSDLHLCAVCCENRSKLRLNDLNVCGAETCRSVAVKNTTIQRDIPTRFEVQ